MDTRFNTMFTDPQNEIFKVVFYPDRVYHAEYLNATRSNRYRYNVREVRNAIGITVMKGEVYMDDGFLCNFLRIEYQTERLVELVREKNRFLNDTIIGWAKMLPDDASKQAESTFKLHYCPWIGAYQVEFWETLEPPDGSSHDYKVMDIMGKDASITRIKAFCPALGKTQEDLKSLTRLELAFRENDKDLPFGYRINDPQWDNDFMRSHQEPISTDPSSPQNTILDQSYLINFQRGWFLDSTTIKPNLYRNAMMDPDNPDARYGRDNKPDDNILEMRWIVQRELGSTVVFFHEVTIPPGKNGFPIVEGTHRHIGTEELYYIVQGTGKVFMGVDDDPKLQDMPVVNRRIYGFGDMPCREMAVQPGKVVYTKSGGIHGILNDGTEPLKFVAFLYHTQ